jgi:hypothetical protein
VAFCLRSVKVVLLMVEANMSSEKVALTLSVGATPVAFALGTALVTLGAMVSGDERGCQCRLPNRQLSPNLSAATHSLRRCGKS